MIGRSDVVSGGAEGRVDAPSSLIPDGGAFGLILFSKSTIFLSSTEDLLRRS
jgi:hypothetical protein